MQTAHGAEPVVELDRVAFVRDGHVILDDVTWTVRRGEHWALIGANGCGKTTLMSLVAGWLFPTRGTVSVIGQRFGTCEMAALRRHIGWVSSALQQAVRPRLTALGVVLTGKDATLGVCRDPEPAEVEAARRCLETIASSAWADLPFANLSQGEKVRVMIARALIAAPSLLVLDEACGGLDPLAREAFLETVQNLATQPQAPTLLFVTHHTEEIVPAVSRVLALRGGRIAASGRKADVLTAGVLAAVFGCPFRVVVEAGRYRAQPVPAPGSMWRV